MMNERPDPDQLLEHVRREEARRHRGRLKIFLGYAAGVGKTYAMLEAAQRRVDEGLDVVVGYVETHGRAETETMLQGLETVPLQQLPYRSITLAEMDLDSLLLRNPDIALVDELAHTNAPGSRHSKRYQDVLELLDAGISVYTTLNIQHLESLNDVVARITEAPMQETVPDYVLDDADEIELVDLPIDELLQRLEEGKVYIPEQAEHALRRFFRAGNLTALREMALRRAADRIDEQMRAYMQTHGIRGTWPVAERLLVCVGPSPLAERLVRTARRLATRLNAEWYAVYVETPHDSTLSETDQERIAGTLRLAESLGGKSVRLPGTAVAETIAAFAHNHNVTKIVAGKPLQSRWRELFRGSIVDQIIRLSRDIDVYVISPELREVVPETRLAAPKKRTKLGRYLRGGGLVLLVTLLGLPLRPVIEPTNLVMLYLLAVILTALWLGRAPAIFASVLSVIAFDLTFVPPFYTFVVADAQFIITFVGLLGVGLVISSLAANAREQARFAQRRQAQTMVLYELSRALAAAVELEELTSIVVHHVEQVVGAPAVVLLHPGQRLEVHHASNGFSLSADEHAVATWTFEHNEPAGRSTDTLSGADGYYLPLNAALDMIGVLGVVFAGENAGAEPVSAEQRRLLESFASQAAVAIERALLATQAQEAQLLKETEKLQAALLNSISHDLRTPLASITGALSSLLDAEHLLNEHARHELVANAYEEADRLNRLLGNLLDMTRLEAGAFKVGLESIEIDDVIGSALSHLEQRLGDREVIIDLADDLPLASGDFVLLVQVFVNLIENAHKYAPPDSVIVIRGYLRDNELQVEILDRGPGIPEEDIERIFEKFYRAGNVRPMKAKHLSEQARSGTGLGLSISKGIIEAHHGHIWAENRPGGGALFAVTLPLSTEALTPLMEYQV